MLKKLFLMLFSPIILLQAMNQHSIASDSNRLLKLALINSMLKPRKNQSAQKETDFWNTLLKRTKSTPNLVKLNSECLQEGWFIPLDSSKVNRIEVPQSIKTPQIKNE